MTRKSKTKNIANEHKNKLKIIEIINKRTNNQKKKWLKV